MEQMQEHVKAILELVGEDPSREGLLKTPHRVAKMFEELLEGYSQDIVQIINGALFENESETHEMIIIDSISFNSMCEHHMLPFTGKVHVAYIPQDKIIGLSKIPRIVDVFSRRLQVQERLTNQIADCLIEILEPLGVIVVVEGNHSCASLRGVKKEGVMMRTVASRGSFLTDTNVKNEFYALIKQ